MAVAAIAPVYPEGLREQLVVDNQLGRLLDRGHVALGIRQGHSKSTLIDNDLQSKVVQSRCAPGFRVLGLLDDGYAELSHPQEDAPHEEKVSVVLEVPGRLQYVKVLLGPLGEVLQWRPFSAGRRQPHNMGHLLLQEFKEGSSVAGVLKVPLRQVEGTGLKPILSHSGG